MTDETVQNQSQIEPKINNNILDTIVRFIFIQISLVFT